MSEYQTWMTCRALVAGPVKGEVVASWMKPSRNSFLGSEDRHFQGRFFACSSAPACWTSGRVQ